MYYVIEDCELVSGKTSWKYVTPFGSLAEANDLAIRKAASSKGNPEYLILNQVGITSTSLPTEVTVTTNG